MPQWTILGPIAFTLYVNDFNSVLNNQNRKLQFADGTSLIVNQKSPDVMIEKNMQKFLDDVDALMKMNRLTLYSEEVSKYRYLGHFLEKDQTFSVHVEKILCKMAQGIRYNLLSVT